MDAEHDPVKKKPGKRTRRAEETKVDARLAPVVEAFGGVKGVTRGKLFSSYGLKVNGKIFAMFGRGRFVVKLPKERVDELVAAAKCERFDTGHGRLMKGWATFKTQESEWAKLAREAYEFVRQRAS